MRGALVGLLLLVAGCLGAPVPSAGGDDEPSPRGTRGLTILPEAATVAAGSPLREREGNAAIDPSDPRHIAIATTERTGDPLLAGGSATQPILPGLLRNAVALSRDGGATWTTVRLPYATQAAATSLWNLVCWTFDPTVGIGPDGVVHLFTLYIGCGGPGYGSTSGLLHVVVDEQGAREPDVAWVGAGGIAGAFNDRAWGAVDPERGTLGWVWTMYAGAGARTLLMATFSHDDGRTWTPPEVLAEAGPLPSSPNYLVHATWSPEGVFVVTAYGCDATERGDPPFQGGQCLWQFGGRAGGPWARVELPLEDCEGTPEGAGFGYASGAAGGGTRFAAAPIFADGRPAGVCVFASPDAGATWPAAAFLADADHPTLALAPDGSVLVGLLAMEGRMASPTLLALHATTLETLRAVPLAEAYDVNPWDAPIPSYGDYDGMDARGGRFVWMLTRPHVGPPQQGAPEDDLDVWAFRGVLR